MSQVHVYEFTRWSGKKVLVRATHVKFTHGGTLTFWKDDQLILGVKCNDWNDVRKISNDAVVDAK